MGLILAQIYSLSNFVFLNFFNFLYSTEFTNYSAIYETSSSVQRVEFGNHECPCFKKGFGGFGWTFAKNRIL